MTEKHFENAISHLKRPKGIFYKQKVFFQEPKEFPYGE